MASAQGKTITLASLIHCAFLQMITFISTFILWNVNPEVLHGFGLDTGFDLRWYGLLFAAGFLFGQIIIARIFRAEGKPDKDVEAITLVMVISTVVGARLGHCLGYEADYYLAHPLEILQIWKGGLASHGATVGILLGIWYYSSKRKSTGQSFLWTVDRIVIVVALGGSLIRVGNLMNSEIIGKPTDVPQAFLFVRPATDVIQQTYGSMINHISWVQNDKDTVVDGTLLRQMTLTYEVENGRLPASTVQKLAQNDIPTTLFSSPTALEHIRVLARDLNVNIKTEGGTTVCSLNVWAVPRHPAQIYEALSTFLLFVLLYALWHRWKGKTPEGLLFGIFVVVLFTLRILYEYLKENQVPAENGLTLNYGQIYSIPLVIAGIGVLILVFRRESKRIKN
jgi:phosphatidylglycerol---prolipoprotein diacylglyceryl transferase